MTLEIEPGKEEVKFRKEPDFGQDKVFRHAIAIGPGREDFLGIAIDLTRNVLYVDINQNLDLTDDPQGVFHGEPSRSSSSYALFKSVTLRFQKNGMDRSIVFEPLYYYDDDSGYLYLVSSYQGEIELAGRKWRLEIQDDLNGTINDRDRFSLIPVTDGAESKGEALPYTAMKIPQKVFLGGSLYELRFTFGAKPEDPPLTVGFTEISSSMGELILEGRFFKRLVLEGDGLAILDSPGESVPLPTGMYKLQTIYLQSAPGRPLLSSSKVEGVSQIPVTTETPAHFKAGGPLESSVNVSSRTSMLSMNYLLKGVGGELYTTVNPDTKNPPTLIIYKGDRQLATGKFQFG